MKLAMAQMQMSTDMQQNVAKSVQFIEEAAAKGADLIFFPEVQLTQFFPKFEGRDATSLALTLDSPEIAALCEACRANKIWASPNVYLHKDGNYYDCSLMIGSDGWAYDLNYPGKPHPRSFGAFPRVIAHYSRERGLFPLETAVYKMTGLPAKRLGLTDRGVLKEGCWADLCIFDPEKIADDPTYLDPCKPCSGISRVYVNGVLTAENGVHTGARAGMVIRK